MFSKHVSQYEGQVWVAHKADTSYKKNYVSRDQILIFVLGASHCGDKKHCVTRTNSGIKLFLLSTK